MIRKIIHIDEEKCNGCGLCAKACHEGAIDIVEGKAKLVREHFCDGLGDCLPNCPMDAIHFEMREAPAYDEQAVQAAKRTTITIPSGTMKTISMGVPKLTSGFSQLAQWPCQIQLAPTEAEFYQGADLLIAADCTAYAYAGMHEEFMKGRVTLIGCPKLDPVDYSVKLTDILSRNEVKSVTLVRMEVPCCGGLKRAVETALLNSGKKIPFRTAVIGIHGERL